MKEVNIENLTRIFEGIWSGELDHDQTDYFCETSCCAAGWDVAFLSPLDSNVVVYELMY